MGGGIDAHRYGDQVLQDQGTDSHHERHGNALGDQVEHRAVPLEGHAKIAVEHLGYPAVILNVDGLIEPVLRAQGSG